MRFTAGGVLLLLFAEAFSQYSIPSFETGLRTIPPSGNDIIIPFEGNALKQIPSASSLNTGEVLLRRRFGAGQYGLFIGRMNEKAYTRLSAFRPPQGSGLANKLSRKYYSQQVTNPDMDLPNAYFDNDLIYVENAARLFYNDGTWRTLSMEAKLPARLTVTSEPAVAQVLIDGIMKGTTPYLAGAVFSPSAVVQVKMDGYYIQEDFVDLEGKAQVTKHFTLAKKLAFSNGAEIDAEAYSAENTESDDELEQRMGELDKKQAEQTAANKKAIDDFERTYPALPPRDEFETTEDFTKREGKYLARKSPEKERLESSGNEKLKRLQQVAEKVQKYKTTIESRVYQRYFSIEGLKLDKYNADEGYFPVAVSIKEGDFDFTFSGNLAIPRDVARDFKQKLSDGRLSLSYRNKTIRLVIGGEAAKRFYDFTEIKIRFNDKDYSLNGSFELPEYLTDSREWKEIKAAEKKTEDEKKRIAAEEQRRKNEEEKIKNMVRIPAGTFVMGSNDGESDEKPARQVTVSGFYMDKTEVTQEQYERVMGNNPGTFKGCPTCPVEMVSWNDAKAYCEKVGKRLPTEAECEYAARAGTSTKYYWGNDMDGDYAWYYNNANSKTHPVGQKKPNAFGLYDMCGNVWEWCSDWYDKNYYRSSPADNPQGAATGSCRVLRGGSWRNGDYSLRSAGRGWNYPDNRLGYVGFRCAW